MHFKNLAKKSLAVGLCAVSMLSASSVYGDVANGTVDKLNLTDSLGVDSQWVSAKGISIKPVFSSSDGDRAYVVFEYKNTKKNTLADDFFAESVEVYFNGEKVDLDDGFVSEAPGREFYNEEAVKRYQQSKNYLKGFMDSEIYAQSFHPDEKKAEQANNRFAVFFYTKGLDLCNGELEVQINEITERYGPLRTPSTTVKGPWRCNVTINPVGDRIVYKGRDELTLEKSTFKFSELYVSHYYIYFSGIEKPSGKNATVGRTRDRIGEPYGKMRIALLDKDGNVLCEDLQSFGGFSKNGSNASTEYKIESRKLIKNPVNPDDVYSIIFDDYEIKLK